MLRFPTIPDRVLGFIRAACVAAVCVASTVVFAKVLDGHFALDQWLVWRMLPIWGYTLLFNAACVAGGAGALRLLFGNRKLPALEWLLFSMVTGFVMMVIGLFLAGTVCQLNTWTALLLPLLFLVAGGRASRRLASALAAWPRSIAARSLAGRVATFLAVGWGVTCLAFMYLEALDVSSINFDATWYHFPIAQDYARIGCIVPFPGEHHRAYPHLTSMVHTWALLVPGLKPLSTHWMLSLHLEYSIVVWRIVAVAAGISWLLRAKSVPGLWAVFFLFPSIFVYDQNIGGSADHFLGFFAMPVMLAAARTLRAFQWRWAALLGIALGGHLLTKYQAVYLLVSVTVICVVRWSYLMIRHMLRRRARAPQRRIGRKRLLFGPAVALAMGLAVTAPHWLKNTIYYHNPVYPYGRSVFTASTPSPQPSFYKERKPRGDFPPAYEGWRRQLWATELLFDYSFKTRNREFNERRPYMGSLFSLLLPCLLFVRKPKRVWLTVAVAFGALLVWANTAPNDRYLLSFYDLLIAATAAMMVKVWELGWLTRAALVPLVGLQLFWGGDAMLTNGSKRLREAIGLISSGYDGKKIEVRLAAKPVQQKITEATPPDAKILCRNFKNLLGLDRYIVSDIRATQFYVSYSQLRDARDLWNHLHERGITHLLYPDGERVPARLNNTVLFDELFRHHALDVKHFGDSLLGTMPPAAPPPSSPYLVLTRRARAYPDGVYRVEQLDVDDRYPGLSSPKPEPANAYSDDEASDLLDLVQAVVVGPSGRFPAEVQARLGNEFEQVERFKEYSLYLRKKR